MNNTYQYAAVFKKQLRKLPAKLQQQFYDRLRLFDTDPTDPRLRIHPLKGKFVGYWSMDISGDLRVIYRDEGGKLIVLCLIGTHSQLYGR